MFENFGDWFSYSVNDNNFQTFVDNHGIGQPVIDMLITEAISDNSKFIHFIQLTT